MDHKEALDEGPPTWWVFLFFCWLVAIMFAVNEKYYGRIESTQHSRHQWEPIADVERRMQAEGRSLYGPKGPVDSTYWSGKESRAVSNQNVVPEPTDFRR